MARVLLPGHAFFIWGRSANLGNYPPVLAAHKLQFSEGIMWDQEDPVIARKDRVGNRVERMGFAWKPRKVLHT